MIKHVVMWRFKEEAEGRTKLENMEELKRQLLALIPLIPEIKKMEILTKSGEVPKTPL